MARKPIKTVRLERQPHREAMQRLRRAYQQLAQAAQRGSPPAERREPHQPPSQEVPSWQ